MKTHKLIIALTIALAAAAAYTAHYQLQNGLDIIISMSPVLVMVRLAIIGVLLLLLFTNVPRSIATRGFVAVSAVLLMTLNLSLLADYQIQLFDAMLFAAVSIIFAIEALELEPRKQKHTAKIRVSSIPSTKRVAVSTI